MSFSFTGISYLLGFIAMGLLGYRFFQYRQKEKSASSAFFFYFVLSFSISMFITAMGALFFAENTQILKLVVILATFFQSFAFASLGYLIIYFKLPKGSPILGFGLFLLLGFFSTIFTIITPSHPHLGTGGGINWDIQLLPGFFRFFLYLITFLPLTIILLQQIKASGDSIVRARARGLSLVLLLGIFIGFFDFFFGKIFQTGEIFSGIALGGLSVIVFLIILLT